MPVKALQERTISIHFGTMPDRALRRGKPPAVNLAEVFWINF